MRRFQKRGIGGSFDSELRHGYMPVIDNAIAAAFRVVFLAKCLRSASHARHEKSLKTPPQSQGCGMAGMADAVRMNVVTRYSVGMVYMLCVSISVRQIATAIQLSLVFFGLRRSGRYRNGSATFVGISVINQLQFSLLFVNSAFVGVRALSFAAFMPCSVPTKLGSILARYHSECSQMSSSTVSNSAAFLSS